MHPLRRRRRMIRIHLKIHRSCRQSSGAQRARLGALAIGVHESSETRGPNALSARANEAFQIIVSCLMCDGQDKLRLRSFT